jgi:ferredoxin-type protein NapH
MSYVVDSFKQLMGLTLERPTPEQQSPEVREIYFAKSKERLGKKQLHAIEDAHAAARKRHKWRRRRWTTLIVINLLFVVSYHFDVQLVEGALTASRVVGFHFADLNSALQVMLAYKHVVRNLLIGTTTVLVLWWLVGGRTFCSWCCPYHLVAEWAEALHLKLAARHWARDIKFHRGVRPVFYVIFVVLTAASGYTVFETISPTGIVSRALIYGPGLALLWVAALLLFEIFVSRRAWCRYICPIGITYGVVGLFSPVRVQYNVRSCHHEGDCRKVCLVPHVLDITIKGRARDAQVEVAADCTRCGLCVDVCPTGSLTYKVKGLEKML